jgi:hypothetical protein
LIGYVRLAKERRVGERGVEVGEWTNTNTWIE